MTPRGRAAPRYADATLVGPGCRDVTIMMLPPATQYSPRRGSRSLGPLEPSGATPLATGLGTQKWSPHHPGNGRRERDRSLPADHPAAAARSLPFAETHLLTVVGHRPQVEVPDTFAEPALGLTTGAEKQASTFKQPGVRP